MLAQIGRFLQTRFPEKVVVTAEDWITVTQFVANYKDLEARVQNLETRLSVVESSAVHKGAVPDLVTAVKGYKDQVAALQVGLGLSRIGDMEIQAMLNGVPIPSSEDK